MNTTTPKPKRMSEKERQRQEAIERLKEMIKPGDTIYTSVKHVARSGMYRTIAVYLIQDNQPRWISYLVAKAIGVRFDEKREACGMGGCGMDMGFALVYDLSRTLFRDGFHCIGEGCRANDHNNEKHHPPYQSDYTVGRLHSDPGYALNQRWM
jgi:hypothetical protein